MDKTKVGFDWINSREKRALDIAMVTGAMPVTIPAILGVLLLSRVLDGEGALFHHQRLSTGLKPFEMYKVRTLKNTKPYDVWSGGENPNATPLGELIRPYGIDELPQSVNILKGDMSVVGLRAAMRGEVSIMQSVLTRNEFDEWLDGYSRSRPGVISTYGMLLRIPIYADLGQESRYKIRAETDIRDIKEASFSRDLNLIKMTGRQILSCTLR